MKAVGAIDIGGTKIAVGMVDRNGALLAKKQSHTGPDWDYTTGIELVARMLRETAETAGVEIEGIGIGSTGPVHPFTGQFGDIDFLPKWRGRNPVEDLGRIFGIGVALENDGDASVLAEWSWGASKKQSSLIYITVGTGIGGGIIHDGKLYRGMDGTHPEVGHHIIDASGPICSCGFFGCWEALASGPAMARWVESQRRGDACSAENGSAGVDAKQIYAQANEGDAVALAAVDRETYYLGLGLANLVNLFAPNAIVLGGSVMKGAGRYLEEIRSILLNGCRFVPVERITVTLASLGDDANLIGAARVWHHRFGV